MAKGDLKEAKMSDVKPTISRESGMGGGKQAPVGVKIISILDYIGAGFSVLVAIVLILGGSLLGSVLNQVSSLSVLGTFGSFLFALAGIATLGIAVLDFFIARGLWKCKKWARIITIVFACLGVLGGITSLIGGSISSIVTIAISGTIGGYLLFSKKVKEAFK